MGKRECKREEAYCSKCEKGEDAIIADLRINSPAYCSWCSYCAGREYGKSIARVDHIVFGVVLGMIVASACWVAVLLTNFSK